MNGNIGMPYGVACKFVPSMHQFQSLENCLLELSYALCCPVLAETHKHAKKRKVFCSESWEFLAIVELILVYIFVWF